MADPMNVLDFQKMKDDARKISMVTCYDYRARALWRRRTSIASWSATVLP